MKKSGSLGRYEMLAPIAAGGMASVWAARASGARGFKKVVAIKTMLPDLANEAAYRTMFLDEARVASKLRHPNICETFDLGEDENGELFMAMEWIDGVSLHRLLKAASGPIPVALAARIIAGACAGLHAAHDAVDDDGTQLAIVHRDVSPQNILVSSDGHVKVTDFGVAKARGKNHATDAGQAKGKLAYMAPEQIRGTNVDRRADVFSLGCVLYEVTTGVKPFEAENDADVVRAILERATKRPSEVVSGYPAELEKIVARAMAKDPNDRFASAEGLRIALERFATESGSEREIARLVHERCGVELASRRALIQAGCTTAVVDDAPARGTDDTAPASSRHVSSIGASKRFRRLTIGLGLAVIAFAFGSVGWARLNDEQPMKAPAVAVVPPVIVTPAEPLATSSPVTVSVPVAPVAAPKVSSNVDFHVDASDARLVVDGEPMEEMSVERPGKGGMRIVLVKAPGRIDRIFIVDAATPNTVEVSLATAPEPAVVSTR